MYCSRNAKTHPPCLQFKSGGVWLALHLSLHTEYLQLPSIYSVLRIDRVKKKIRNRGPLPSSFIGWNALHFKVLTSVLASESFRRSLFASTSTGLDKSTNLLSGTINPAPTEHQSPLGLERFFIANAAHHASPGSGRASMLALVLLATSFSHGRDNDQACGQQPFSREASVHILPLRCTAVLLRTRPICPHKAPRLPFGPCISQRLPTLRDSYKIGIGPVQKPAEPQAIQTGGLRTYVGNVSVLHDICATTG